MHRTGGAARRRYDATRERVVRVMQNGKRHRAASGALNCREERRRRRRARAGAGDQLVAFIWVQMEFFLNGRFESLPLSGIVWPAAEGREKRDARASATRNRSAKALISWRHGVKGFLDCPPRIYSWFVRFPRGNCRSAVPCLFRIFRIFVLLSPLFPSVPFSRRDRIAFRGEM